MRKRTAAAASGNLLPAIGLLVGIGALYFARQILIPFALAILCAFLLNPAVKRLQYLRIPRVAAVLLTMIVAFGALAGIGWVVTDQLVEIINDLPQYRNNIDEKMATLRAPSGASRLVATLQDLGKELTTTPPSKLSPVAPRKPARSARAQSALDTATDGTPVKVEVIEPTPNALQSVRNFLGPLLGPLETMGIVLVFALFMLIDQEDLRNRLLRLLGSNQLHRTTKALDDAARRVSRYLMMQFLVNASLGAVVAMGLYFIGVRSFLLWGVLTVFLRFVPYVGIAVAGALPFLLAVATTDSWRAPVLVIALFFVCELITGNLVEPMVYGAHTGLSSVAILAAIVFWTALWGPVGLILSTPLTVCLSVLGRYSPHLEFLNVLLGDEPVLTPEALFYQRLLALDSHEALTMAESFLRDRTLIELYDEVIVPALAMAEQDRHSGQMEAKRERFVIQSINEIVTEVAEAFETPKSKAKKVLPLPPLNASARQECRVFCFAAHDAADELTSAMLAQLSTHAGFPTLSFPYLEEPEQLLEGLAPQACDVVCVSSVPPLALTHARKTGEAIHAMFPEVTLLIGLWGQPSTTTRVTERLQTATGGFVVTSFAAAMAQLRAVAATAAKLSDA
ncbi:AI-2E family transporter [Nevskia soli]|jgi:predicted PurR-regulated permease PerM|uniref:AI-2E family transporter n=1 Tax=Nevskia soli TaxID=418856 RepID=UPI0015D6CBF2|nr:AI-2E family transporter [Nevskia soli]